MIKMPRTLNFAPGTARRSASRGYLPLPGGRQSQSSSMDGWTSLFGSGRRGPRPSWKMDTGAPVSLDSRVAFVWDDTYLYAAYRYEDHEIWARTSSITTTFTTTTAMPRSSSTGTVSIGELGVNPINTIHEVF